MLRASLGALALSWSVLFVGCTRFPLIDRDDLRLDAAVTDAGFDSGVALDAGAVDAGVLDAADAGSLDAGADAGSIVGPTDGLVLYYRFGETGTARDSSPNGLDGTLFGAVVDGGKLDTSAGSVVTAFPPRPFGTYTVSFILERTGVVLPSGTLVTGNSASSVPWTMELLDGRLRVHHGGSSSDVASSPIGGAASQRIAIVFDDSGAFHVWVEGSDVAIPGSGFPGIGSDVEQLTLGSFSPHTMDELRVYERALSAAEVLALWR